MHDRMPAVAQQKRRAFELERDYTNAGQRRSEDTPRATAPSVVVATAWRARTAAGPADDPTASSRARWWSRYLEYVEIGDVTVDFPAYQATKARRPLELSLTEFALLGYLVTHRDRTLSRAEILRDVWRIDDLGAETRVVDVYVAKLRRKIEPDPRRPRYLVTVSLLGYCFWS